IGARGNEARQALFCRCAVRLSARGGLCGCRAGLSCRLSAPRKVLKAQFLGQIQSIRRLNFRRYHSRRPKRGRCRGTRRLFRCILSAPKFRRAPKMCARPHCLSPPWFPKARWFLFPGSKPRSTYRQFAPRRFLRAFADASRGGNYSNCRGYIPCAACRPQTFPGQIDACFHSASKGSWCRERGRPQARSCFLLKMPKTRAYPLRLKVSLCRRAGCAEKTTWFAYRLLSLLFPCGETLWRWKETRRDLWFVSF